MQEIYIENIRKVLQNKKELEKKLDIKITNRGKNLFVEGEADNEFTAMQVMEAINCNFSVQRALSLNEDNIILQKINIKDITKRNDLERVRARIIGTQGKTLKTLNNLTECSISINNNRVGIIGPAQEIEDAVDALTSIINGSKQSNIYSRLEKRRKYKKENSPGTDLEDDLSL
ncbi:hypothetical protein GOV14_07100 [Candidatus Pacearchaeota archaeon]|nr:hypothetical protein [Candidatus Pacearchaeota archaeon]